MPLVSFPQYRLFLSYIDAATFQNSQRHYNYLNSYVRIHRFESLTTCFYSLFWGWTPVAGASSETLKPEIIKNASFESLNVSDFLVSVIWYWICFWNLFVEIRESNGFAGCWNQDFSVQMNHYCSYCSICIYLCSFLMILTFGDRNRSWKSADCHWNFSRIRMGCCWNSLCHRWILLLTLTFAQRTIITKVVNKGSSRRSQHSTKRTLVVIGPSWWPRSIVCLIVVNAAISVVVIVSNVRPSYGSFVVEIVFIAHFCLHGATFSTSKCHPWSIVETPGSFSESTQRRYWSYFHASRCFCKHHHYTRRRKFACGSFAWLILFSFVFVVTFSR